MERIKVLENFLLRHYDPENDIGNDPGKPGAEDGQDQVKQADQGNIPSEPFCDSRTNPGNDPVV